MATAPTQNPLVKRHFLKDREAIKGTLARSPEFFWVFITFPSTTLFLKVSNHPFLLYFYKRKPALVPGFPGGASGKEPACQCRRCKRSGFDPWVGRIPLEKGVATDSSILAWIIPWTEEPGELQSIGCKELDTTEAT